jgi:hypothetical protein
MLGVFALFRGFGELFWSAGQYNSPYTGEKVVRKEKIRETLQVSWTKSNLGRLLVDTRKHKKTQPPAPQEIASPFW